ncbi:MAG: hypothetical protein AB1505_18180 [Candidatus Latescibacterota bacterium]
MPGGRWLARLLVLCAAAASPSLAQDIPSQLARLLASGTWVEARLADGRVVTVRVDSLWADSVAVLQAIGPLQERRAVLAVGALVELRELGPRRIRPLAGQGPASRSVVTALALEAVVPGAGYFYAAQPRAGLTLLGLGSAVGATAVLTGKDGAAAWVPLAAWLKVASLLNLRDEVLAMNRAPRQEGEEGGGAQPAPEEGKFLRRLRLGLLHGPGARGMALRLRLPLP